MIINIKNYNRYWQLKFVISIHISYFYGSSYLVAHLEDFILAVCPLK